LGGETELEKLFSKGILLSFVFALSLFLFQNCGNFSSQSLHDEAEITSSESLISYCTLPDGAKVKLGDKITAYSIKNSFCGQQTCQLNSIDRVCQENGELSGDSSFQESTCQSWTCPRFDLVQSGTTALTFTNNNLTAKKDDLTQEYRNSAYGNVFSSNGKWYFEVVIDKIISGDEGPRIGIASSDGRVANDTPGAANSYGYNSNGTKSFYFNNIYQNEPMGESFAANDTIGVQVNLDDAIITFFKNGVQQGTISGIDTTKIYSPYFFGSNNQNAQVTINFGQTAFKQALPVGYQPWSIAPDLKPEKSQSIVCDQRSPLQNNIKSIGHNLDLEQIENNFNIESSTFLDCPTIALPDKKFNPPARGTPEITHYVENWQKYTNNILHISDSYLKTKDLSERKILSACVLDQIYELSKRNILAEPKDSYIDIQGEYERKWLLGSLFISYSKIMGQMNLTPGKVVNIESWIDRAGGILNVKYDQHILGRPENTNNHLYWAAMALAVNGSILKNNTRFNRAIEYVKMGLDQVDVNGLLPLELARGKDAFVYHIFALQPLIYTAEITRLNNIDLYSYNNGALIRLVDLVIRSFEDYNNFTKYTEIQQAHTPAYFLQQNHKYLDWMEIYYARTGDVRLLPYLKEIREVWNWRLSNVSLSHGLRCL
jgi:poly(beta-D-mannuronate) lyase